MSVRGWVDTNAVIIELKHSNDTLGDQNATFRLAVILFLKSYIVRLLLRRSVKHPAIIQHKKNH